MLLRRGSHECLQLAPHPNSSPYLPPLTSRELNTGTGPNRNPSLTLPQAEPMQGSGKTYLPGHTEERKWWSHLVNVILPTMACGPFYFLEFGIAVSHLCIQVMGRAAET